MLCVYAQCPQSFLFIFFPPREARSPDFYIKSLDFYLFFLRFYLFMGDTDRERGRDTAEGEAGSMQGARRGTRSRVSRITPRAEGGAKPLSHLGCPASIQVWPRCPRSKPCALGTTNHFTSLSSFAQQVLRTYYVLGSGLGCGLQL